MTMRTDTNEMEMIPGMDEGGSYGPIQRSDDWDAEAFKRKQISYMTAVVVWALVIGVVLVVGAGLIHLLSVIL